MSVIFDSYFKAIESLVTVKTNLMEVCGTHTVAISRSGIRSRLPHSLRLLSGPGCPVCVSPTSYIDSLIELSLRPKTILVTFGDLMRVPGSETSLQNARSRNADIRIVYSPVDSIDIAVNNPEKEVIFAGVGFETTLPTIAASVRRADQLGLKNYSVLSAGRLALPAMTALLQSGEVQIDGFICPGHVSVITGFAVYIPLAETYKVPCVIAGFEPSDILKAIAMLLEQKKKGEARVENAYIRAVEQTGNETALALMRETFDIVDAEWRGIGIIPASGVVLNEQNRKFDAAHRFSLMPETVSTMPKGCRCGELMRGLIIPTECPLFGSACTPAQPVGPCMVSSEGACAAYYRFGDLPERTES